MTQIIEKNLDLTIKNWLEKLDLDENLDTESALQIVLNILEYGDFQQRWDVTKIIPKLGVKVVDPLIKIVEDQEEDEQKRWFAIKSLAHFPQADVIFTLVNLLNTTEDEDLAEIASNTLANLGEKAITSLSVLLENSETRLFAVQALAKIPHPSIITPLLTVVNDDHVEIRAMAISTLAGFSDERICPILVNALQDKASKVRKEAIMGLSLKLNQLAHLNFVELLKPYLNDINLEVCQQAAIALSRLADKEATEALGEVLLLPTTPLPLAITIIKAYSWIQTRETLLYLEKALYSLDFPLIIEIIKVFGRIENLKPQATEILLTWYNSRSSLSSSSTVKKELAYTLGQLHSQESRDLLETFTKDQDETVKFQARSSLNKL
jgi:HEAT repeat protein